MKAIPLLHGTTQRSLEWQDDNAFQFSLHLDAGLHLVSLQCDMASFDWERLWMPMTKYDNAGQRTGPWDFDLYNDNVPLIPAWRIFRDGVPLGLFYLQRPTIEDIDQKVLRGQFGFLCESAGEVTIVAEPLNESTLDPIAVHVEKNAFDELEEQAWTDRGLAANWAHHIAEERGWDDVQRHLTEHGLDEDLDLAIAGAMEFADPTAMRATPGIRPQLVGLLCWAWRLRQHKLALTYLLQYVSSHLERDSWGNPNPLGYGHNGDMACGESARSLALIYNWLGDDLGELKAALLARLEMQIGLFLNQQLVMQQYWGGALQQDHGFRSTQYITTALLYLVGHSERAPYYLSFYIPRMRRMMAAYPRDGFIPFAQYHKVQLATNQMCDLRTAWRFATGEDAYDLAPGFRHLPRYVLSCFDAESCRLMVVTTRGDRKDMHAGLDHFLALAQDYGCENAKYLAYRMLEYFRSTGYRLGTALKCYSQMPQALLLYRPDLLSPDRPQLPALQHFPDSGALFYRDNARRYNVAITCLPNGSSFHSLGTDVTGTDMGLPNPSCGNFSVAMGDRTLLQTAESGYLTGTHLTNVLRIDGQGQYGDNGYAMGVPMRVWRGQRIQSVRRTTPDGRYGRARLNLAPAYPDTCGVLDYTRDFDFAPDRLIVRDTVVCREAHTFSYRFPTWQQHDIQVRDHGFRIVGGGAVADVELRTPLAWSAVTGVTEIVWAYGNEQDDNRFHHVEWSNDVPCRAFIIEFHITTSTT